MSVLRRPRSPFISVVHTLVGAYCIYVIQTHVKARTGCAALPKPCLFGFSWLELAERVLHHSPEACLHQVWSSSPCANPPLPLILFPLTLIRCDLDADNWRTASPFLTPRQLTHFQRGITLFLTFLESLCSRFLCAPESSLCVLMSPSTLSY